ncbi:MAG: CBS domain-containing protein [Actinophytocola sp.]|nr:CBS domain-containing protein [Actinophytocola sp.]
MAAGSRDSRPRKVRLARITVRLAGWGVVRRGAPRLTTPTGLLRLEDEQTLLDAGHHDGAGVDTAGGVRGLVTLNRLKRVPADQRGDVTLAEVACPPGEIPQTSRDESLTDLLPRMAGCEDGRALVVEDGRLIGIVTSRDISHAVSVSDLSGSGGALHPWGLRR